MSLAIDIASLAAAETSSLGLLSRSQTDASGGRRGGGLSSGDGNEAGDDDGGETHLDGIK